MRRIFLLLIFFNSSLFSQSPSWNWAQGNCIRVTTHEHSVVTDQAGNAYYTSCYQSDSVTFGNITLHRNGWEDFYLVKYNPAGNVLWAKTFGGPKNDESHAIAVDKACNVYIGGFFFGPGITFGNITLANPNVSSDSCAAFVAKFDSAGNTLWALQGGGNHYGDEVLGLSCDNLGNLYCTGYAQGNLIKFGAVSVNSITNWWDLFTAKFDTAGNVKWLRNAGCVSSGCSGNNDMCTSISSDAGGTYIGGFFNSRTLKWGSVTLYNSDTTAYYADCFLVKYDTAGNVLWAQSMGESHFGDDVVAVGTDDFGHLYVAGNFSGATLSLNPGTLYNTSTCSNCADVFISKWDTLGHTLWASNVVGQSGETAMDLSVNANSEIVIAGVFYQNVTFGTHMLTHNSAYGPDGFVAKYDSTGSNLWATSVTGQGTEYGSSVAFGNGDNIFVAGNYDGTDPAVFGGVQLPANLNCSNLGFIAMMGSGQPFSIADASVKNKLAVYPNPVQNTLNISSQEELGAVSIYNAQGIVVCEEKVKGSTFSKSLAELPAGMYLVHSSAGNARIIKQ